MAALDAQTKKPVIVISLLTAACLLGDSMLYIVLPIHWQEAGLTSLWEVGILLSVNRLVRLPLNPAVGWLYGRMSSKSGILLAGLLAAATTLAYAFAKGFLFWLFLRCLWGVAWTFLRLGAYFAILAVSEAGSRGHYMGLYNGLYRLGSLGGMLLGGLLADRFGISVTAIIFGTLTCLALPVALHQLSAEAAQNQPDAAEDQKMISLLNTNVLWTLATGLLLAMIYQGTFTSALSYLIQVHSASDLNFSGFALGAASLAGILQALRWAWEPWLAPRFGRLSDGRLGRNRLLSITLGLAALLFALLPLPLSLKPWLLLLLGIQLSATILTTVIDAIACDVAFCSPQKTFMTAYSFAIDVGAAIGPLLGYFLSEQVGPYSVYWLIALILALLAAKWLLAPISIYRKALENA